MTLPKSNKSQTKFFISKKNQWGFDQGAFKSGGMK
jgi:hypothetical protein